MHPRVRSVLDALEVARAVRPGERVRHLFRWNGQAYFWDRARFEIGPCPREADVLEVERKLGLRLPPVYRDLVLHVGVGRGAPWPDGCHAFPLDDLEVVTNDANTSLLRVAACGLETLYLRVPHDEVITDFSDEMLHADLAASWWPSIERAATPAPTTPPIAPRPAQQQVERIQQLVEHGRLDDAEQALRESTLPAAILDDTRGRIAEARDDLRDAAAHYRRAHDALPDWQAPCVALLRVLDGMGDPQATAIRLKIAIPWPFDRPPPG